MFARILSATIVATSMAIVGQTYGLGADLPPDQVKLHGPYAVHGYFVNSVDVVFFRADTAGLNEYLEELAKNGQAGAVVVYHEGKLMARSPWPSEKNETPADWSTTIGARDDSKAKVDVYLGGRIDKDKIMLPEGVQVFEP